MIEPTEEMIETFEQAAPGAKRSVNTRAGLTAVLAIVERDVLQPAVDRAEYAGHERGWRERGERDETVLAYPPRRGGRHPHYCVSCSDGHAKGDGCINCRSTGYDQSPWPDCEQCRFARRVATP